MNQDQSHTQPMSADTNASEVYYNGNEVKVYLSNNDVDNIRSPPLHPIDGPVSNCLSNIESVDGDSSWNDNIHGSNSIDILNITDISAEENEKNPTVTHHDDSQTYSFHNQMDNSSFPHTGLEDLDPAMLQSLDRNHQSTPNQNCFNESSDLSIVKVTPANNATVPKNNLVSKRLLDRYNGLSEEEVKRKQLPDYLKEDLDMVVIAINPSLASANIGHHYSGTGNHFWECLYESGLIPHPATCYDDASMLNYGIGFTNFCTRPTKGTAELTRRELKQGIAVLMDKIHHYKPKIAVFNGKGIYAAYVGHKNFHMGKQPSPLKNTNTHIFVMPSSSARCAQLPQPADKLPFFMALKKMRDWVRGEINFLPEKEVTFVDYAEMRVSTPDPKSLMKAERRRKRMAEQQQQHFYPQGAKRFQATRPDTMNLNNISQNNFVNSTKNQIGSNQSNQIVHSNASNIQPVNNSTATVALGSIVYPPGQTQDHSNNACIQPQTVYLSQGNTSNEVPLQILTNFSQPQYINTGTQLIQLAGPGGSQHLLMSAPVANVVNASSQPPTQQAHRILYSSPNNATLSQMNTIQQPSQTSSTPTAFYFDQATGNMFQLDANQLGQIIAGQQMNCVQTQSAALTGLLQGNSVLSPNNQSNATKPTSYMINLPFNGANNQTSCMQQVQQSQLFATNNSNASIGNFNSPQILLNTGGGTTLPLSLSSGSVANALFGALGAAPGTSFLIDPSSLGLNLQTDDGNIISMPQQQVLLSAPGGQQGSYIIANDTNNQRIAFPVLSNEEDGNNQGTAYVTIGQAGQVINLCGSGMGQSIYISGASGHDVTMDMDVKPTILNNIMTLPLGTVCKSEDNILYSSM